MSFKNISFIGLCLILASCETKKTEKFDLEYTVTSNLKNEPTLDVQFKYKTDGKGVLNLDYVNSSMGDTDIFNCIKKLKVENEEANISFVRDSNLIKIKSVPNKELVISYSIAQDFKEPLYNHHRYRPIITKDYFHVLGVRLFMVPSNIYKSEIDVAKINVKWNGIPNKGIIHNSFGKNLSQTFTVNQENLFASFFVGGDFRRKEFLYKNKSVYWVTRGDWKNFNDEDVFNILKETITFQNNFWKDTINSSFSVSLLPTQEKNHYSIGGSGFSNSFISFASNNQFVELKNIAWLYNHELLHKWLGRTIKNKNEVQQYWFSEGFTNYYSYKLLLKNNQLSVNEFLKEINTIIAKHYKDPLNAIPNSKLTFNTYWGDYKNYQKLPYRRGLTYAFLIDMQIKLKSNYKHSLDNVMLDLLAIAKSDSSMRLNNEVFKKMLLKYLGKNSIKEFNKHILEGKLITFKEQIVSGLEIKNEQSIPQFVLSNKVDIAQVKKELKL
ncbi:M61 family metallopeptidase [Ichthyenterobacterium magnum]|uniref:M61 glycyl aminopeptidase n=1 Tax=Ichthyenterobacterium magnum TaxID=1230530 RepID=A0A420DKM8_9FLAO|nr:M1 family aminopeptidase [Ichthyenterobacterium magnum]RKE94803.1 M61 glycyl aminopeptidase [Ichthyenterobacterium magnum]